MGITPVLISEMDLALDCLLVIVVVASSDGVYGSRNEREACKKSEKLIAFAP